MSSSLVKFSGAVPTTVLESTPNLKALEGKSVLVTGGAIGYGAKLVEACASAGAYVTFGDIREDAGKELAQSLSAKGYHVHFVNADVRSWTDQINSFKEAIRFSPSKDVLDHVIINAGVFDKPFFLGTDSPLSSLEEDPPKPDTTPIDVNTTGAMYTLKLAQLYMSMPSSVSRPAGSKSILYILSPESYFTIPAFVIYAGSKFGTRGLFRASREVISTLGIRVNAIAPWLMETNMSKDIAPVLEELGVAFTSLEKHVKVAMHLVTNEGINGRSVVLGQNLVMDLMDDEEGGDGGPAYWKLLNEDIPHTRQQFVKMYGMMGFDVDKEQKWNF